MPAALADVQEEILAKLHEGEDVDRVAVLAAHPEFESDLIRFFAVLDAIETPPSPPKRRAEEPPRVAVTSRRTSPGLRWAIVGGLVAVAGAAALLWWRMS